jgi:hypothetical protein
MYELRSGILHGSDLMQMDQDLAFGLDPPDFNDGELHRELWSITHLAMRNWLKNPQKNNEPCRTAESKRSYVCRVVHNAIRHMRDRARRLTG